MSLSNELEKQKNSEFETKHFRDVNQFIKTRKKVVVNEQRKCNCCGVQENITKDHIIPIFVIKRDKLQGFSKKKNRQWLCGRCNGFKGSRVISINELRKEHYLHIMSRRERKKLKQEG